ncbi:unnamed protein product [Euphydryas editha]|uniref:Spaetzle domain-containing protein n=1 Tax=Euphydryas editha TaxID=104508 RepID=A0AAU9V3C3_EUPED|nr:unnamed protein product [Euphydryas editha]
MSQIHIVITFIYIIHLNVGQVLSTFPPPVVSSSCMNVGICETVENYPTELARKLVKELKDSNALIADDPVISTTQKPRQPIEEEILNIFIYREMHERKRPIEIPLCTSKVEYKHPKCAKTSKNVWKYIINDDDQPIQTFRVEQCKYPRTKCSEKMFFIPNYESVCIQKWILKEMYYIKDDHTIGTDYFKVPSCCACRKFHTNK